MWRDRILASGTAVAAVGAAAATFYLGAPMHVVIGTSTIGLLSTVGMFAYGNNTAARTADELVSNDGVSAAYARLYARQVSAWRCVERALVCLTVRGFCVLYHVSQIAERDEFTQSLWQRVRDNIKVSLTASDLAAMDTVKKSEFDMLEGILETEIPRLRRLAAIPQYEDEPQDPSQQAPQ